MMKRSTAKKLLANADPSLQSEDVVKALKGSASKYHNKPTVVDGIWFQSKKEADRWCELKLLEQSGAIHDLRRQTVFELPVFGMLICKYKADFGYFEGSRLVVEDVKSDATRTEVYRIKRKLMKAIHNIDIQEI